VRALRYGALAALRRRRSLLMPALTTATSGALLALVLAVFPAVREQSARFGDPGALSRTTLVLSAMVLVVAAVEVAIGATRSIAQRRSEIGVLTANGVSPRRVLVALVVEPVLAGTAGSVAGAALAVAGVALLRASGAIDVQVGLGAVGRAVGITLGLSIVMSALAGLAPAARAVRRPPLASLRSL